MPATSQAQYRLMQMVAHDPGAATRVGIPQSVGQDYAQATPNPGLLPKHAKAPAKAQRLAALLRKP